MASNRIVCISSFAFLFIALMTLALLFLKPFYVFAVVFACFCKPLKNFLTTNHFFAEKCRLNFGFFHVKIIILESL